MSYYFTGMTVLTGAGNYSKPAAVAALMARIIAAGGGAGGASSGLAVDANGAGGGAGGYGEKLITSPASSIAYDCGTGGAGGTDGTTNGSPGGNASFDTLTANGGGGGTATSDIGNGAYAGADGGAATATGDVNCKGSVGGDINNTMASGWKQSGKGGHGIIGSGGQGRVGSGIQAGLAGNNYGSGGGGPASRNSATVGGAGSPGLIVLFELELDSPPPAPPATGGLSPGIVTTLVANQVYAAPSGSSFIYYQGTQPQQSADQITWTNITNGTMVAGGFIRSTAGDTIISLKRKVK